jgi:hypothetical protein
MQFTAEIDYKKLSKAFEKIPIVAAKELRTELNKSLRAIQIDARLHHRFSQAPGHTGQLVRSVQQDVEQSGLSGKVWLEESVAPYGKYVHDGTKPHVIRPKNKAALFFVKGGQKWFVPKQAYGEGGYLREVWRDLKNAGANIVGKGYVNHPGTKPDPFLFQAFDRQKPYFLARVRGAAKRIFDAVGL